MGLNLLYKLLHKGLDPQGMDKQKAQWQIYSTSFWFNQPVLLISGLTK